MSPIGMKRRTGIVAMLCLGALLAATATAATGNAGAATGAVAPASGWKAVARWPDLMTGMWAEDYNPRNMPKPVLTAAAQAELRRQPKAAEGNGASCKPLGMPEALMPGYPMAFFYTRGSIFIMSDMDDLIVRHVFMNRGTHGDPDPSWNGDSIGHWDGDTLVIDTAAIDEAAPLAGLPSGGGTHIVERIHMTAPDKLEWMTTVDNPAILAKPWQFTKTYVRHRDWTIEIVSCLEGNRDAPDASGKEHVDLTPPK